MKIGILSDLHFHEWRYGSTLTTAGLNSRLVAQKNTVLNAISQLNKLNVDFIVICGDVFHTNNNMTGQVIEAVNHIKDDIRKYKIETFFIVGNHDWVTQGGDYNCLSWLNNDYCHVIEPKTGLYSEKIYNKRFGFKGYTEEEEEINDFLLDSTFNIGFMHQGIKGIDVGNGFVVDNEAIDPKKIPENKFIVAGHYHNPTKGKNFLIPGAPMHHTWSDKNDRRGFWVLDSDTLRCNFFELNGTRFIEVKNGDDYWINKHFAVGQRTHNIYRFTNFKGDRDKVRDILHFVEFKDDNEESEKLLDDFIETENIDETINNYIDTLTMNNPYQRHLAKDLLNKNYDPSSITD